MTLSVVAIRSAVNQYGIAFGPRSLLSVWRSLAAYDENSSSEAGSTLVSPRIVLTRTGKKTITATMVIRGRRLSGPNQLSVIGAKAMIGIALAPMATGSNRSRAVAQRAVARPQTVPNATPITSPPIASAPVKRTPLTRDGHSETRLPAMTLGRGIRNDWTPSRASETSQASRTTTNTTTAGIQSSADERFTGPVASPQPLGPDPFGVRGVQGGLGRLVVAERLADARHELEVARRLARLDRALSGQIDVDHPRDPAWPSRHHDHPRRQEDGLR